MAECVTDLSLPSYRPQFPTHCISAAVVVACDMLSPDVQQRFFNAVERCSNNLIAPSCNATAGASVAPPVQAS